MRSLNSKLALSILIMGGLVTTSFAYYSEGDQDETFTGQSTSVRTSGTIGTTLTDINREESTSEKTLRISGMKFFSGKVIFDSEKGKAKIWGFNPTKNDADISAGILSYSKDISDKLAFGVVIPYRKVDVDDEYDTKLDSYTFVPYIRIKSKSSNGRFTNNLNFFVLFGYNKLKTRALGGKGTIAFYEIGAGALYNPILKIRDDLRWSFSMQLAIDRYLTNYAMVDTWDTGTDEFYKNSITRSGKSTYIGNIGTSFIYTPIQNLDITIGFLRVQRINKPAWQTAARNDYYYIKANYRWNRFRFGLGFKQLDGVNGYEEYTYMASISYDFF